MTIPTKQPLVDKKQSVSTTPYFLKHCCWNESGIFWFTSIHGVQCLNCKGTRKHALEFGMHRLLQYPELTSNFIVKEMKSNKFSLTCLLLNLLQDDYISFLCIFVLPLL